MGFEREARASEGETPTDGGLGSAVAPGFEAEPHGRAFAAAVGVGGFVDVVFGDARERRRLRPVNRARADEVQASPPVTVKTWRTPCAVRAKAM